MNKITSETSIAIGVVVTLICAAITFGVLWEKVGQLEVQNNDKAREIDSLRREVAGVKDYFIQTMGPNKGKVFTFDP